MLVLAVFAVDPDVVLDFADLDFFGVETETPALLPVFAVEVLGAVGAGVLGELFANFFLRRQQY